jgi:hypothetical protein
VSMIARGAVTGGTVMVGTVAPGADILGLAAQIGPVKSQVNGQPTASSMRSPARAAAVDSQMSSGSRGRMTMAVEPSSRSKTSYRPRPPGIRSNSASTRTNALNSAAAV